MVRMLPDQLAELDAWIADQAGPKLSRPAAIRRLVHRGLPRTVEVSVSDERHSWGGDAVMTAPKPKRRRPIKEIIQDEISEIRDGVVDLLEPSAETGDTAARNVKELRLMRNMPDD